jgi:hypothetical protein
MLIIVQIFGVTSRIALKTGYPVADLVAGVEDHEADI